MTADTHVKANVQVAYHGDGRVGSRSAMVTLEATGAVSVPAKTYAWNGVAAVEAAELAEALARWDYGEAIRKVAHGHPTKVTGQRIDGRWQAEVIWESENHLTVTAAVQGFADLDSAHDEARRLVNQLVAGLVPPDDAVARRAMLGRCSIALGFIEDWAEPLFRNPGGK